MSYFGGTWLQNTSKGKSCGFIWINIGSAIFFGICGYQNLAPGCAWFLYKLTQTSFEKDTRRTRIGSALKNLRATSIMYPYELGKEFFDCIVSMDLYVGAIAILIIAFCEARILGLISTRCTCMLLSGISFENTYDNMGEIIQYAPLECQPLTSPFQLQVREENPLLTLVLRQKPGIAVSLLQFNFAFKNSFRPYLPEHLANLWICKTKVLVESDIDAYMSKLVEVLWP